MTALHFAAINGTVSAIEAFVEAGADGNARDKGGMTPLHEAAYQGSVPPIEALVKPGQTLTRRTSAG